MTASEIKQKHPLDVYLTSRDVELTGAGAQKKANRCATAQHKPGHFCVTVDSAKGVWHCNDCGHGGDVIRWMALERGKTDGEILKSFNGAQKTAPRITPPFDWERCVSAFTADHKRDLAEWRGLSPAFIDWLHGGKMVGIHSGGIAFPVQKAGQIIGCHYLANRAEKFWSYHPKGNGIAPLVFGDATRAVYVLAFESQWDAFSAMDKLGWHLNPPADTAVFCTRGAGNGRLIRGQCSPDAIVFAFPQNDLPDAKGRIAAEIWLASLADHAGCKVLRVATPARFKDVNDWARAGASHADIEAARMAATLVTPLNLADVADAVPLDKWELSNSPDADADADAEPKPKGTPLSALIRPCDDDESELLRHRFLCRGGGMLLCGPTGIGKSALIMQSMLLWGLGRDSFGIAPVRPLKSVIIQAENDDGDMAEMRDGVILGLGLTSEQVQQACNSVFVYHESERLGAAFFTLLDDLLTEHKPDLLFIDPALAFLGGESNAQRDVGAFLRNGINPIIRRHQCGCIIIHHTNKPPSGKEKSTWQAGDFAYLGSGSAEWANWARAVIGLRSIGSHDVFELTAAKRGARLGWKDESGAKAYAKNIAHAKEPGVICWREAGADERPAKGRAKEYDLEEVFELLPQTGLTRKEWIDKADDECGISRSSVDRARHDLRAADRISKSVTTGKWQPVTKRRKP